MSHAARVGDAGELHRLHELGAPPSSDERRGGDANRRGGGRHCKAPSLVQPLPCGAPATTEMTGTTEMTETAHYDYARAAPRACGQSDEDDEHSEVAGRLFDACFFGG